MKKKMCLVVGKFAYKDNILDGQSVKCRTIYEELIQKYGKDNISIIDTYNWKKHPLKIFIECIKGARSHKNVIIMPAHNGIKVFAPLFSYLKKIFKNKTYYIVIGSWLFEKVQHSNFLKNKLQKFDKIFVETTLLKKNLEEINFCNIEILRNYKKLDIVKEIFPYKEKQVIKACMFSRVNKEKGIVDAIQVIKELNNSAIKVELDIYGMIEEQFKEEFQKYIEENKEVVSYNGIIDSNKSVETIKKYDILLFPTKYITEGIPGTIIDSYAAGVPVLASKWQNYNDIIEEQVTGLTFEFNNIDDFKDKMEYVYENQKEIYNMKINCLKHAKLYCEEGVLFPLFNALNSEIKK